MKTYLVADRVAGHPTCEGWRGPGNPQGAAPGKPYWRPSAIFPDLEGAERWAGAKGFIVETETWQEAIDIFERKRLPT